MPETEPEIESWGQAYCKLIHFHYIYYNTNFIEVKALFILTKRKALFIYLFLRCFVIFISYQYTLLESRN